MAMAGGDVRAPRKTAGFGKVETDEGALVLFSGGQDSAICLAWALARFARVHTIAFDYGQRHAVELECRESFVKALLDAFPNWARRWGGDGILEIRSLASINHTSLTTVRAITDTESGLPSTFLPGRNILFLAYAAAVAYGEHICHLVGGMCETDFSGYPDCRDATVKTMGTALTLGIGRPFVIHTPLMWLDKSETWRMADEIGGETLVNLVCEHTHTCYLGHRSARHDWGYGCGDCPACRLRAAGFTAYRAHRPRAAERIGNVVADPLASGAP